MQVCGWLRRTGALASATLVCDTYPSIGRKRFAVTKALPIIDIARGAQPPVARAAMVGEIAAINRSSPRRRYLVATFFNPTGYYAVGGLPGFASERTTLPPSRFNDVIGAMQAKTNGEVAAHG
jgi:hypothetical protein